MANALYASVKQALGLAALNLSTATLRVVLVDLADYTPNLATDEFLSAIPAAGRVASGTLTGVTWTGGVLDAADLTLPAVTGDQSEALVLYADGASDAARRLIAYFDTVTGLPVTPNGGDVQVVWDNGANKIFKL